eukprot:scaffold9.g3186.t1
MASRRALRAAPAAALLLAALLLGGGPAGAEAKRKRRPQLRLEDIVIAYPADTRHLEVARASRAWRKGIMRTFIANNVPAPPEWLLYMDDDTIFFPDAVLRLLEDFDPDLPYFISDHFWWPDPAEPWESHYSVHPHKAAPRCLPCHFDTSPYEGRKMDFPAPKGCPCTPELLCAADRTRPPAERAFNRHCDYPRHPWLTYSMHGGAGGIMSVGLMRRVSFEFMEACTKSLYSTGGDSFITICLWQAGYAMTDPGKGLFEPSLQARGARGHGAGPRAGAARRRCRGPYFDPGPEDRYSALVKLSGYVEGNKWGARCNDTCQARGTGCGGLRAGGWALGAAMQLENMVSLHVRSRTFETLDDAAEFIRAVSTMYEVYALMRRGKEQRNASQRQAELAAAEAAAAAAARQGKDSEAARQQAEQAVKAKAAAEEKEKKQQEAMPQAREKATEMAHAAAQEADANAGAVAAKQKETAAGGGGAGA